jgi:hypothetical protein
MLLDSFAGIHVADLLGFFLSFFFFYGGAIAARFFEPDVVRWKKNHTSLFCFFVASCCKESSSRFAKSVQRSHAKNSGWVKKIIKKG